MNLPDLAGQPPWVVVVVFALFVAGTVGLAWVRKDHGGDGEDEDVETARPVEPGAVPSALTSGSDGATLVAQTAMMHLAEVAKREAAESAEARREADEVRAQLHECGQERHRLQQQLERRERECERLALRLELCERRRDEGRT